MNYRQNYFWRNMEVSRLFAYSVIQDNDKVKKFSTLQCNLWCLQKGIHEIIVSHLTEAEMVAKGVDKKSENKFNYFPSTFS